VADSNEFSDEPSSSGATELVTVSVGAARSPA
jgi:hypothetical protein